MHSSGDAGARELTRAVKELRLRGVFVESAKRDLLLGDKETRPTLEAAADARRAGVRASADRPAAAQALLPNRADRAAACPRHDQQRSADHMLESGSFR